MGIGFYLYLALNSFILYWYYKKDYGVFQAPFLVAYTSIFVLLPQLATIYSVDYYHTDTLGIFIYVLLSCNIAFVIGFEFAKQKYKVSNYTLIRFSKIKVLLYVFACIGFYSIFMWSDTYQGSDNVIQANMRSFASYAFCLTCPFLIQRHPPKQVWAIIILCVIPIAYFAFFVKGSRGSTLFLILVFSLILSIKYPSKRFAIKKGTLLILIIGAIASASIVLIRHFLVGNPDSNGKISLSGVTLLSNYEASFNNEDISVGMDLGNAAIGIDFLSTSMDVDYGITYIWDNFIQNYVPRRVVGESFKKSLKLSLVNDDGFVERQTCGITTMTGYYYAYRSFNILAPLLFLFIGILIGYIWAGRSYSMFNLFVYLVIFSNVPLFITHGPGYIYNGIEFLLIFMYPFIRGGIYKKQIG